MRPHSEILRVIEALPDVKAHLTEHTTAVLKSIGQYDRRLWSYTLDLYRGGDPGAFIDGFAAAIKEQLTRAWNAGARDMGVEPADMTDEDMDRLQGIIDSEYDHVLDLAQAIQGAQELSLEDFRSQFRSRIDLWVNRYNEVTNDARVYFGGKQRLVWTLGATEEHCTTCDALNGIVAYAYEWEEAGIKPQNPPNDVLECGGWKCDCSLEVTDQRRTPNALQRIMDIAVSGNI